MASIDDSQRPLPAEQPGDEPADAERQDGRGDAQLARMARGGSLNLVGAVVQQGALFTVMAVLAHGLGKSEVGRYSEVWSLLAILGLLSLAGFRAGLTRFVAVFLAENDAARVRGTVRLGMGVTVIGSTLIASALALSAHQVAGYFHDPTLVTGIRLAALALPAATFSDAALAATQGWRSQRAFAYIGRILDPLTLLGLTGLALVVGWDLQGAFWAIAIGAWSTAVWAGLALRRRLRTVAPAAPIMEPRRIFGFSMVSWFSALAATGLIWTGTLLLGNLADAASVGVFNIATRLVTLAVFVMAPITTSFAPHMAHLHHVGEQKQAARAYGNATRWILFISTPAFIMLIVMPDRLLAFFGHEFRVGAEVTMILALGQFVAAAAGPCGVVLNMSGRVALSLADNVGVLIGNVVLSLVLIPRYGIVGAASAWSISLVAVNLVKLAQARWVVGVAPTGAGTVATVISAIPAALVAWLVRETIAGPFTSVLVAGVAVLVVYLTAHLLVGLHPDDRVLLERYLPRVFRARQAG